MSDDAETIVTPRWWHYDSLPSGEPYDWGQTVRGTHPDDNHDFHLDLGCGRIKKGRLGIDHFADEGVDLVMDLDNLHVEGYGDRAWELDGKVRTEAAGIDLNNPGPRGKEKAVELNPAEGLVLMNGRMPFPKDSIESIISHHCLEHIGPGFIRLMDECHRILRPGGIFRIIVPLFPSHAAITDPDHVRYFTPESFKSFCGDADGNSWLESFSTPYTTARFEEGDVDYTPRLEDPREWWTEKDARELRLTLRKHEAR